MSSLLLVALLLPKYTFYAKDGILSMKLGAVASNYLPGAIQVYESTTVLPTNGIIFDTSTTKNITIIG